MNNPLRLIRDFVLLLSVTGPLHGAIMTYVGSAYTPAVGTGKRQEWSAAAPLLNWDDVVLSGTVLTNECTSPCGYTYNSGPMQTVNVSGQTISSVTFAGANSAAGAGAGLYVRQLGSRNTLYNPLSGNGAYPQWVTGLATVQGAGVGTPSITITLPTGTRSAGFDFGSINSSAANITISATTTAGSVAGVTPPNRYDIGVGTPNYLSTGPGFYGITSTDSDIVTITISGNANSGGWILNIANFRFGTAAAAAPVPETSTQFTLGAALITISVMLRRRRKIPGGGNA